jgi:pyruvate kinase
MVANLRRAEGELGKRCRVLMDLAGPDLRTGPLRPGPQVMKLRPRRDAFGKRVGPARVWLTGIEQPAPAPGEASATLPVPDAWLARLDLGAQVAFKDARGRRRELEITGTGETGRWAECSRSAYVTAGTVLVARYRRGKASQADKARVGPLPPADDPLRLKPGDTLLLTRDLAPGEPATGDETGHVVRPARIGCTLPEVFADIRAGEAILFDQGRIGGIVETVTADEARVKITTARSNGSRLLGGRPIHLPESTLRLSSLTAKDVLDLRFIADHADLVGISFVRHPAAVHEVQDHLEQLNARLGIVVKIETRAAFEQLPYLLLAAMRAPAAGVLLARGDLAVECGYERLAEVQEEVLWLAEAAHLPVIWGNQVLARLAQRGRPTQAEITDAAMAERAECVLLGEGPYVGEAVQVIDGILRRMQAHQSKKFSLLRRLRAWSHIGSAAAAHNGVSAGSAAGGAGEHEP